MIRRVASLAIVAIVAIAAAACSGGSDTTASTTTTNTSTSTTTTSATTVPATVPLSPAASAQEAATRFVDAWQSGNQLAAATIAVQSAVDTAFAAGDPGVPQNRGCNRPPADSPVLCVYRTAVGELQLRVQPGPDGWIIDQAIVSAA